jgi:hypothetical protein
MKENTVESILRSATLRVDSILKYVTVHVESDLRVCTNYTEKCEFYVESIMKRVTFM